MFIFVLQLRHLFEGHPELYLFAVYSALIWAMWLVKVVLSARYRPYATACDATTSVVVPVVDEPVELFRDVIGRMVAQQPGEIIVVINGARNTALEAVCEEFAPLVTWTHTPIPGKRNAVKIGTELSTGELTILVDSDTVWTDGTLSELVKPFADPRIGGVTTRQRILEPERSWITRWADWLENSRALYSMPAQSVLGQIGCLPGRTIAFRRTILMRVMPRFMSERFLGVFLEVSDDRTLTNLTLKEGYRTVYQYSSLVYTDAPLKVKKLFKQQLRWARGSQYNTLRMLPWMLGHAPVLALFFIMDIVLPFMLAGVIGGWIVRAFTGQGYNFYQGFLDEYGIRGGVLMVAALMVLSSVVSMGIRQLRHLAEKPSDFLRMPVFIIVSTFFLMPIRILGFVRMAHASGWGTRAGAYAGGGAVDSPPDDPVVAQVVARVDAAEAGRPIGSWAPPVLGDRLHGEAAPMSSPRHASTSTSTNATSTLTVDDLLAELDEPARAATGAPASTAASDAPATPSRAAARPARRRPNPWAAIPYLVAVAILATEAVFVV